MKDLIEHMARAIVEYPDEVVVTEEDDEDLIVYRLRVAERQTSSLVGFAASYLTLERRPRFQWSQFVHRFGYWRPVVTEVVMLAKEGHRRGRRGLRYGSPNQRAGRIIVVMVLDAEFPGLTYAFVGA